MTLSQDGSRKDTRESLLDELESIRALLNEDRQHTDDRPLLADESGIPLLLPDDAIPTLSEPASSTPSLPGGPPAADPTPAPAPADPLDAVRAAAARIAATAARHRREPPAGESPARAPAPPREDNRQRAVDEIMQALMPRLEAEIRKILLEKLG